MLQFLFSISEYGTIVPVLLQLNVAVGSDSYDSDTKSRVLHGTVTNCVLLSFCFGHSSHCFIFSSILTSCLSVSFLEPITGLSSFGGIYFTNVASQVPSWHFSGNWSVVAFHRPEINSIVYFLTIVYGVVKPNYLWFSGFFCMAYRWYQDNWFVLNRNKGNRFHVTCKPYDEDSTSLYLFGRRGEFLYLPKSWFSSYMWPVYMTSSTKLDKHFLNICVLISRIIHLIILGKHVEEPGNPAILSTGVLFTVKITAELKYVSGKLSFQLYMNLHCHFHTVWSL